MIQELKTEAENQMKNALSALANELKKVRTGRAQISMLDMIKVNYYGQQSPLNQVASVTCPDAKSFMIAPWEPSLLKEIEQAIIKSELGMAPQNDGKVIRLKLPELTEQRRKELAKGVSKIVEDARVSIRMARRDANEKVKGALKDKKITEDENKKSNDEIQKLTDDYIKKVDKMGEDKERELLSL
jgi:ribosome recycling factor